MGSQKVIQDSQQIEAVLSTAKYLCLALSDSETPYIVPMSFGYKKNAIYLHSSREGRKIEILKKNPWVCFEANIETEVITADDPCNYNVRYRSVIGHGQAKFLEDYNEKVEGLTVLSEHYGKKGLFEFEEWKVNRLCVIKIEIETMTGKESGF
ncbi:MULTISPECIES: pyridoxamine 5'-phosphate oxidase family protein [unclassified Methanosarcina]|uniref:pyridoxamine 5'-phosphate oxidase family protein n=1 Tax=unclassified Methanosarcina TaxID=2644672 RepID=UPI0006155847|nr:MULTISPECIES: pyridoxamine 5'-phosphate oxidase family protein [unclassified Methanosarcina]AKB18620.1 putative flavin-nucleotide-binding protein [Methanosarcina sp. WWM596]AKB21824.1 putative flavin-nucleotide-binding protein [Methanosarcina sp. WH1]